MKKIRNILMAAGLIAGLLPAGRAVGGEAGLVGLAAAYAYVNDEYGVGACTAFSVLAYNPFADIYVMKSSIFTVEKNHRPVPSRYFSSIVKAVPRNPADPNEEVATVMSYFRECFEISATSHVSPTASRLCPYTTGKHLLPATSPAAWKSFQGIAADDIKNIKDRFDKMMSGNKKLTPWWSSKRRKM